MRCFGDDIFHTASFFFKDRAATITAIESDWKKELTSRWPPFIKRAIQSPESAKKWVQGKLIKAFLQVLLFLHK